MVFFLFLGGGVGIGKKKAPNEEKRKHLYLPYKLLRSSSYVGYGGGGLVGLVMSEIYG